MSPPSEGLSWLIRIPEVFAARSGEILKGLDAVPLKKLGSDYHLVRLGNPEVFQTSEWAPLIGWNLPVHHAWPCLPQKMEGFVTFLRHVVTSELGNS